MGTELAGAALAELSGLSTTDRVLALYELGIQACATRRRDDAVTVLVELMGVIDLDYGEIAEAFFRLYEFCLGKVGAGDFLEVAWVLQDLRDAWHEAAAGLAPAGSRPAASLG